MICDILKLFSQNVRKNKLIINTILETQFSYNIIFFQEPLWSIIYSIPSSNSHKGELLVGILHYPNWLTFARFPTNQSDSLRVMTYINICVSCLQFSITNFIQLVSPQPVDQFSQTKLFWKSSNEGYPHIYGIYKSDNKWLRYQAISSCKSFVC